MQESACLRPTLLVLIPPLLLPVGVALPPPAAPLPSSCAFFFLLRRSGATWAETQVQSRRLGSPSSFLPYSLFHLVSLSPLLLGGGIGPRRGGGEDGYNGMARRGRETLLEFWSSSPLFCSPRKMLVQAAHHSMRRTTYGQFFGEKKKVFLSRGWGRERRLFSSIKSLPRCLSFFAVSNERRSIESVKRGFGCFCHLPSPLLFDFFCDAWSEFTRPPHFALCPPPPASLSRRHSQSSTSLFGARRLGNIFLAPPSSSRYRFVRTRSQFVEREGGRRLSRMPPLTFPVRKCRDALVLTFLK